MRNIIVIPARLNSTRLPQKLLQLVNGKTVLHRSVKNLLDCKNVYQIFVVTSDDEICREMYYLTGVSPCQLPPRVQCIKLPEADNGTHMVHKLVKALEVSDKDNIINVQADEPTIPPEFVDHLIDQMKHTDTMIHTICIPAYLDQCVTVALNKRNEAMYFSRYGIPHGGKNPHRHLGIYGYKGLWIRNVYPLMQPPINHSEKLEQLQWLENMWRIKVHKLERPNRPIISIDTEKDLNEFRDYIGIIEK